MDLPSGFDWTLERPIWSVLFIGIESPFIKFGHCDDDERNGFTQTEASRAGGAIAERSVGYAE